MVAPLRILALSHSANLDGAEQVFLETMAGLHARGHTINAVLPGRGPLSAALEKAGLDVEFQPLPWWILPPGQLDAAHLLAQLGPQVETLRVRARMLKTQLIHTSTSVILHGALTAAMEGLPHLWQIHEMLGEPACGLDPTLGPAATWQFMAQLSTAPRSRLLVASPAMQSLAAAHFPAADRTLTLLPHGHNLQPYLALPIPTKPSASRDPVRFVVIASVTPRKGLDLLIRALADYVLPERTTANLPPFEVEIIGAAHDRDYLKQLQAQAKAAKVAKFITWSGYRNDLPERLRHARAVLHPSRSDPSPVGLILAMAAAKPIVATRCGGPEKMLENNRSGRLINVDDAPALGAEILNLLRDPAYGSTWGPAARAHAEATWSLETYLDRLEKLYSDLTRAAAAPASFTLDPGMVATILSALHRHRGEAANDLKHLTPRQKKALSGIVKSAKLLKKTLPANLYDKLAGLW